MTAIRERTVLFADLRGSTGLYESLGNAEASALVTQTVGQVSEAVLESRGQLIKTLGDGLMAAFDTPRDGVRAAQRMQEMLERDGRPYVGCTPAAARLAMDKPASKRAVAEVRVIDEPVTVVVSDNLSATIDARVAELDRLISSQLSAVMHAPEFQKLESTWRGLNYLVKETQTGTTIKIKALNATKRDLVKDFKTAIEFDQSALFKKVYEEEFGTFGGAPFGALIGDYEITRQPEDMYFIEQMAHVAAAAHAPFIASSSPELLGLESFADLGKPRDLAKVFDTVEYAKWKSFRDSEDSRYVGLTLPRFLGRLPYNPKDGTVVESFSWTGLE